ncbi:hypothetical protein PABG_11297 [Paracoccidioides brasiliensis Pb03]|nr:hypothetical protein PABG_11297 [Paracoccidioides brasiliensis Pb03]
MAPYVAVKRDQILVGMPFEFWNMIFLLQHPSSGSRGGAVEGSLGNLTLLLASSRDFEVNVTYH